MPKILQTATTASQLGLWLLLALVIVLPCSAAPPTIITLYNFNDLLDGGFPNAGLVMSTAGALYGTTSTSQEGWGSVFEMVPGKGGVYTEKTLYTFTGGADGANPLANLVIGTTGVLYGTTYGGGANGYGTVFQVAPGAGGTWAQSVLYSFKGGTDGANPEAGLVLASNGVLYGTTYNGGTAGMGTVFDLVPAGGGAWTESVLYSFQGGTDGANPVTNLTLESSGPTITLYGTTSEGGSVTIPADTPPFCTGTSACTFENWGTVFQLTGTSGVWTETLLYTFLGSSDGGTPESPVIIGPKGVLYGSTFWGGTPTACPLGGYPQGCGTIYQLTPPTSGGAWTQTVLHTFTGTVPDGNHPYGSMALNATNGQIFGTTYSGGAQLDNCFTESYPGCGTVFSLKPPATSGGTWTKSNLSVFLNSDGGGPNGGILSAGGALFGTTLYGGTAGGYGTVYEMKP